MSGDPVVSGHEAVASPLLLLLHLSDSLFPLGGFAHSDGLEAATASGGVVTGDDLSSWMDACLDHGLARCEGPAVVLAWRAFDWSAFERSRAAFEAGLAAVRALDAEVHALRPSRSARAASRTMGTRLVKTWLDIHRTRGAERLAAFLDSAPGAADLASLAGDARSGARVTPSLTLPVAFGLICASAGIDTRSTTEAYLYTRLAATISCAMRVMAIGQHEAHARLGNVLARIPAVVDGILDRGERPTAFVPMLDLAAMSHQYVHSRLFRS
jgi:urease accessory protein